MIQGIFSSHQGIVGDRVGDFSSAILQYNPTGTALFLALTSGMPKAGAADTVFTWFEDSHQPGRSSVVAGGTTTTLSLDDASYYVPGSVLLVEETGEHMLVTAGSGNDLTVIRGLAGTVITAVNNTMHVQQIGNAHEEGSGMPTAKSQQGHPRLNYVQIFRNTWAITGTAKAVQYRTGSKLAKNKKECAMFHAEDMERAFLWGRKHIGTLNNNQFRMTDGLVAQIENYGGVVETANSGGVGQLSIADLEDFIRRVFELNIKGQPNERTVLTGNQVLAVIQALVRDNSQYNISQGESKFGIAVTSITTVFGTLRFVTHPLMNESPLFTKEMYVMHPGAIRKRMLRETNEEGYDANGKRIQGRDADEGIITTEGGLEVGGARTMGIYRNITSAAPAA